ncbi:hypothetical protein EV175_000770 [Coemansia sp. RSA 1933]|nr:hypothetical protein EV175_000770 [Coemansia sp. RSA 1933]
MRSMGVYDSSKTLDEGVRIGSILHKEFSNDEQHAARLDLCGWIRRPKNSVISPGVSAAATSTEGSRKPNVIYRRNKPRISEKPSNVTAQNNGDTLKTMASDVTTTTTQPKPGCPTEVAKLLSDFSRDCGSISSFMNKHGDTMEPLMRYVLDDAHFMPSSPGVVPVNDRTVQHLPPLAAEEYATHISRITYFVRMLQALEAADPENLSSPYARQLIDLLFDLERVVTLPRVDFLRTHAETVHAMSTAHSQAHAQQSDTILAIGNADEWVDLDTDMHAQRILHTARSIPRHFDLRSSTTNTSQKDRRRAIAGSVPGQSTCDGSILGDRLRPESNPCSDVCMVSTSNDPLLIAHADTTATDQGRSIDALAQSTDRRIYASTPEFSAVQFHPKLHPVVEPCPMDVSNLHQVAALSNTKEGKRPRRLYRRTVTSSIEQSVA